MAPPTEFPDPDDDPAAAARSPPRFIYLEIDSDRLGLPRLPIATIAMR